MAVCFSAYLVAQRGDQPLQVVLLVDHHLLLLVLLLQLHLHLSQLDQETTPPPTSITPASHHLLHISSNHTPHRRTLPRVTRAVGHEAMYVGGDA